VALVGLDELARGTTAAVEAMASARSRERLALEKHLGILGTLGNNAPFIGLFGTVIGIIKAFADLAKNQGGGAAVVMSGIAEALVATAVGLMVALARGGSVQHLSRAASAAPWAAWTRWRT
jgi:biopolymer transport protein ExbB/TolQ